MIQRRASAGALPTAGAAASRPGFEDDGAPVPRRGSLWEPGRPGRIRDHPTVTGHSTLIESAEFRAGDIDGQGFTDRLREARARCVREDAPRTGRDSERLARAGTGR